MKIDKEKLNSLVELSDDELWRNVVELGRSHGLSLPNKTPSHDELDKLRAIVKDGSRLNMTTAVKLLSKYRSK